MLHRNGSHENTTPEFPITSIHVLGIDFNEWIIVQVSLRVLTLIIKYNAFEYPNNRIDACFRESKVLHSSADAVPPAIATAAQGYNSTFLTYVHSTDKDDVIMQCPSACGLG